MGGGDELSLILPGGTFVTGDGVVSATLEYHLEGMTLATIQRSEFSENSKPLFVSASEPVNPEDGDIWFDDTLKMIRKRTKSRWEPIGKGQALENNTGQLIAKGNLVRYGPGADECRKTNTLQDTECIGVVVSDIPDGSIGIVQANGLAQVLCTPAATVDGFTAGTLIVASGNHPGWAETMYQSGVINSQSNATYRADIGIVLGMVTIDTLATCLIWR